MMTCELMFEHWNEQKCSRPYDFDRLLHHIETSRASRQEPTGSKTAEGLFGDMSDAQAAEFAEAERIRAEKAEEAKTKADPIFEK
jgi:hypothetical protein